MNYEPLFECSLSGDKLGKMINSGMECTLSRFVNGTKLCGMVDMLVGRNVIQTDLDHLERWAYVNLLKFNNTKYNPNPSPVLDQDNSEHKYRLGGERIESSPGKKDLGVWLTRSST